MNKPDRPDSTVLKQTCAGCGRSFPNIDHHLQCPDCGKQALLVSHFDRPLELDGPANQFSSYRTWLSYRNQIGILGPEMACIRSEAMGDAVGLSDLWVLISGYSPKYGSTFVTGTFKECEAIGVLNRVREQTNRTLIVSSAGNAGRAFLELGARYNEPAIVVLPESVDPATTISALPARAPLLLRVRDAFYPDVIRCVDRLIEAFPTKLVREGGCYNTARRDSMAVPFLRATRAMDGLPDYYVQAVGSGTGAIATWEAAQRLVSFGHVPNRQMKLLLVQNFPFSPMVDAWQKHLKAVEPMTDAEVRAKLAGNFAAVLSNANPPYQVTGGVRDALVASNGLMIAVGNEEIQYAQALARSAIDFEPCPAASAALAGLIRAVREERLTSSSRVLLHLTGGGLTDLQRELGSFAYPRSVTLGLGEDEIAIAAISDYLNEIRQ